VPGPDVSRRGFWWFLYYAAWLAVLVVGIWLISPSNSPKVLFEVISVAALAARVYTLHRVRTVRATRRVVSEADL
jgi:hypothetical protein